MQTKQRGTLVYDSFDEDGIVYKIERDAEESSHTLQNVTQSNRDVLSKCFLP